MSAALEARLAALEEALGYAPRVVREGVAAAGVDDTAVTEVLVAGVL